MIDSARVSETLARKVRYTCQISPENWTQKILNVHENIDYIESLCRSVLGGPEMSREDAPKVGKHGAAESIRMLLEIGGEKLGKLRAYVEHWLNEEEQSGLLDVHHTIAVARSIGAAAGLVSGDHWMDAQIDTMALVMYELLKKTDAWYIEADKTKRETMKKELLSEIAHYYFNRFENSVKTNGGHFSINLSWVDVFFFGVVEVLEMYFGVVLIDGKFPFLMKLIEEIGSMPVIRKYIEKRRNKAMENLQN